jgi:hypothetical protein
LRWIGVKPGLDYKSCFWQEQGFAWHKMHAAAADSFSVFSFDMNFSIQLKFIVINEY